MISDEEKKRYVLKERRDIKILHLIHDLEKSKQTLSDGEKVLLSLIRTQLEEDWRTPLLQVLQQMKKDSALSSKERMMKLKKCTDAPFWKPK